MELNTIATEQRNSDSALIDQMSTSDMVRLINNEDKKVADAVEKELDKIASAIDITAKALKDGGRLFYVGCGTSGRLGILDAVECVPTFSVEPEMVQGLIAGGYPAIFKAVEGAEDDSELGKKDLKEKNLCEKDVVVGIAASGRTPYVIGAMEYARSIGCSVFGLTCVKGSPIDTMADIGIAPMPGAEVVTGSTRMKSGTAEKMVLNMLSTGVMIKLGKVYGNLMVDVKPSNEKLIYRCVTIVQSATGVDRSVAQETLEKCDYRPKVAIVMIQKDVDCETAKKLLEANDGRVSDAIRA